MYPTRKPTSIAAFYHWHSRAIRAQFPIDDLHSSRSTPAVWELRHTRRNLVQSLRWEQALAGQHAEAGESAAEPHGAQPHDLRTHAHPPALRGPVAG